MLEKNRSLKQMLRQGRIIFVLFLSLSLVFTTFTPAFAASGDGAKTKMKHTPPKYFVPEHRIQLDVRVSDPKGVELVRCYFKASGESDFVFVPMTDTGKNNYSGVLPAPSPTTEQIEYLFLSVNTENVVVKSQSFFLDNEEKDTVPAWQEIPMESEIKVSMELDHVPSELTGFSDSIVMDTVESGLRFGFVAGGLYQISAAAAASTTGSAASATTAGTISAGTAGMSTAEIVGVSALGALAAGGVAAAASSSSGSSSPPPPEPPPVNGQKCDTKQSEGGPAPDTRSIFMGTRSGSFNFSYDALSIPDQFIIYYGNSLLHDTGCVGDRNFFDVAGPGSGIVNLTYRYDGQNKNIQVRVIPNCHGKPHPTRWNYTVTCP